MKRALTLLLCATLFAAACGDDDDGETTDGDGAGGAAAEQPAETEEPPAEVDDSLLQPTEVPEGWSHTPEVLNSLDDHTEPCDLPTESPRRQGVGYTGPEGPIVMHLSGPVADPEATLGDLRERIDQCAEARPEGQRLRWAALDVGEIGEETVAAQVVRESDDAFPAPLTAHVISTRQGESISTVIVLQGGGEPDAAFSGQLARQGADRL